MDGLSQLRRAGSRAAEYKQLSDYTKWLLSVHRDGFFWPAGVLGLLCFAVKRQCRGAIIEH
jgi:hypothetical protein